MLDLIPCLLLLIALYFDDCVTGLLVSELLCHHCAMISFLRLSFATALRLSILGFLISAWYHCIIVWYLHSCCLFALAVLFHHNLLDYNFFNLGLMSVGLPPAFLACFKF
ncbi:unnamed protein product [Lupinus luteus]|uniref:Uncharacterized protein n=1 Tax=Lupinus luteus TaxID=3873 RepID=A0AAV1W3R0_LUPLU